MKRLLGIASLCVIAGLACGGEPVEGPDAPTPGAETDESRHPTSGFTTFSSPPSADAGTWDFTVLPDNSAGETCDPADPEACSADLMCCPAGRNEPYRCMEPIRVGDCPKVLSGPSGGRSHQSGPFVPR